MKTTVLLSLIRSDFVRHYRGAARFVDSGPLWDFCLQTISDPLCMEKIVFANDLGIPPVRSLLLFYERAMQPAPGFQFTENERKWVGSLMGFVFRFGLGYQHAERCTVNLYGFRSGAFFWEGPMHTFEA